MDEEDAERMAEKPEPARRVAAGSREDMGEGASSVHGGKGIISPESMALMEQVVGRENLMKALKRVVANKGAPGIDGMTVEELAPYLKKHWPRLRRELLEARYKPEPVRAKDIPKPGGKGTRRLGIPTVLDRFVQQSVLQVLTPMIDPAFSVNSYGYRPGRSAQMAVKAGREYVADGYRWVADLDIEKFFDRVNHDVLMARVARRVKDKRLLKLIRAFLNAGIMAEGVVEPKEEGTPQGGPLSPLLSNILLDDLDKELERRGHRFCRYADDCNVYVRSKIAGERVMDSLAKFLKKRLKLRLNREKSAVGRPWKRKFLGYSMTMRKEPKLRVSREALKRVKGTLRQIFRRGRGRSLKKVIGEINRVTRGWYGYYRLAQRPEAFAELDRWIRRRCRWLLWRQWKLPRTRIRKLIALGTKRTEARTLVWFSRGPWRASKMPALNYAVPLAWLANQGLWSLLQEHQRTSVPT